jgi:hypothetical protein
MVTADHDTSNTGCDFHITDWADTTSKTTVSVSTAGCRSANLQISSVSGATLSQVYFAPSSASATVATADFTKGDWLFRLTNNANPPTVVYAEAWLHSSDDVAWSTDSSTGRREVTLDSGAIFSQAAGTVYLEKSSVIGDATFGASYYGLWLRTLTAASYNTITGAGSHQVYLSLLGNYDRVDNANVYRLRYDIAGPLAQSWCNGLVNRDNSIASQLALYTSQGASCAQVTTDGVRSVCFEHVAALSGANACTTAPSAAFTFRFLHARIYTSLAV